MFAAARERGIRFSVSRKAYGSPRSVTSNAHGFRIAVHRVTGEIRILYSVHATDAGVVINPAQVRGQIEGGVAQAIGFALTENFHVDENGVMVNPNLRNYRIPTYADIPAHRGAPRRVAGLGRADGVEGHRGVERQPGGAGAGQRTAGRHRRPLPGVAADARADLPRLDSTKSIGGDLRWTPRSHRHRGHGHHRAEGPRRLGAGRTRTGRRT